jgi:hypothetical protein
MKNLILAFAVAMLAVAPGLAQEIDKEKPGSSDAAQPAKEDADKAGAEKEKAKFDRLKPYKTKGNTWTHKVTSKVDDSTYTSYTKYEVLEGTESEATVKMTTLDSQNKELGSSEFKESLNAKNDNPDAGAAKPKESEEKIKVAAGEFDCVKQEVKADTYTTTTWYDKNTGLVVKITSKSDTRESTTELTEQKVA